MEMKSRRSCIRNAAVVATLAVFLTLVVRESAFGQSKSENSTDRAVDPQYGTADIRVLAPGIAYNAGLLDLAASYTRQTGKKVAVNLVLMGVIVKDVKSADPPADVIMLPTELLGTLSLDGGIVPGTFLPLGRSEMGLAVRAGAPHPDISTVENLAAALRGAQAVMRSNPARGSMVARLIEEKVIKRPEFSAVHSQITPQGEGGEALSRGEGDMAIQAICEILPHKQIELVGPLPRELGAWIDIATAVSARSKHRDESVAFLKYLLRPESKAVWKAKGMERFD
jgi:molybdate transport system substrate-binding protein